jgi:hypothetical protein
MYQLKQCCGTLWELNYLFPLNKLIHVHFAPHAQIPIPHPSPKDLRERVVLSPYPQDGAKGIKKTPALLLYIVFRGKLSLCYQEIILSSIFQANSAWVRAEDILLVNESNYHFAQVHDTYSCKLGIDWNQNQKCPFFENYE